MRAQKDSNFVNNVNENVIHGNRKQNSNGNISFRHELNKKPRSTSFNFILSLNSKMPVKDLLARIEELRDVMTSCQEKMSSLVKDYQVNVLQTAAVIAAAKITEEKAGIEKKRQRLRKQIEKERERSQETVKNVCSSAAKTIEALIRDQEKELREAVKCAEQQQEVRI